MLCGIGLLPWLTRTDPALTVLRARAPEGDPSPEALEAIRAELGLAAGPLRLLGRWLGGLLVHGDAGRSWVSGAEVMPSTAAALGVSALLMAGALMVAVPTAAAVSAKTLWHGSRHRLPGRGPGWGVATLAALPEFVTASVLATVIGVRLGWLPALGWYGPRWMVLPACALGLPAGAVLGRMLDDRLRGVVIEPWLLGAAARGLPAPRIARQALRRCVPAVLPNLGQFAVGLTGGAVAIEQIFDIPGLGRLTLNAALAQDLPVLQTGTLALLLFAAVAGWLARLTAGLLLGPAVRDGALPAARRPPVPAARAVTLACSAALVVAIGPGLLRDPLVLDTAARLRPPSWAHPFGTDALGRDVLARIGHGALPTLAVALAVSAFSLVAGVALGLLPRLSGPLSDTANAVPAVLAGLLVAGVVGGGPWTPALAVAAVAWAPLATHTSALLREERAAPHLAATRALGAGPWYLLRHELLPAVLPPVLRHALLRLPGVALALAALGFLGLGAQPPSPEWGLLLAENLPYAERAPWALLAPTSALVVLGVLAVSAANWAKNSPARPTRARPRRSPEHDHRGTWRSLPPLPRLLILTQLAFNVGFFAVLPFLATHLGTSIGMAGWLVGFVLGLRTFSQQGLFVVGGALVDRFGVRPVVLAGCLLRIIGFGWLGFAEQAPAVIGAVLLIGFSAALFSPAVESEVARQAVCWEKTGAGPRTRVLALFTVAGQAGAFTGPLLGVLLLAVGFRAACLAGVAIFAVILSAHLRLLPQHIPGRVRAPLLGGVRVMLGDRRFLAVSGAYGGYLLAYNQLYLALPAEVERVAGTQAPVAWLFALSSLLVVAAQLPVTGWAARRLDLRRSVAAGLLTISCGFAVVAAAPRTGPAGWAGLWPVAGFVVALTIGQMLVVPAARAWIPDLAADGRLGLYTGAMSSISGLIVLVGSAATGSLLDLGLAPAAVWTILAVIPLVFVVTLPRPRHPAGGRPKLDAGRLEERPGRKTNPLSRRAGQV